MKLGGGKMKVIKTIQNVVLGCFMTVMIGIVILFVLPPLFGNSPYAVLSGSMEPEYHVGSIIYVEKALKKEEMQVGDVITFNNGSLTITHRIVDIDNEKKMVYTKGDANDASDGPVAFNNIIGRASKITFPAAGYFLFWIKSIQAKIVCVVIVTLLVLLEIIDKILSENKKNKTT